MKITWQIGLLVALLFQQAGFSANFGISGFDDSGKITWTNAFKSGVATIQTAPGPNGPWTIQRSYFTTNITGGVTISQPASNTFIRAFTVDVSTNTTAGYTNLLNSYGTIETIAGKGTGGTDGVNYWLASYEGGRATNAALSRPHMAIADNAGNVFIVDKFSHSVLKVSTNGNIYTVAGTHVDANGPDTPTRATNSSLSAPNGLWVRGDGSFYVLDTGNNKVRRVDTNGMMSTVFTNSGKISGGRSFWVKDDESMIYFGDGIGDTVTTIKKWTPSDGVTTLNSSFIDAGNFAVITNGLASGALYVTDRGLNGLNSQLVYLTKAGARLASWGISSTSQATEGTPLANCPLSGVRGIWFLPNGFWSTSGYSGGYLLATHEGSQVLYVDARSIVHVFVNGQFGNFHSGDGQWFHTPGAKITECRAVTVDPRGNILITENDYGFVRRVNFKRLIAP